MDKDAALADFIEQNSLGYWTGTDMQCLSEEQTNAILAALRGRPIPAPTQDDAALAERIAEAMYWNRVDPGKGAVVLSIAVMPWRDLEDQHMSGLQVWHCKQFWRDAANAALVALAALRARPAPGEGEVAKLITELGIAASYSCHPDCNGRCEVCPSDVEQRAADTISRLTREVEEARAKEREECAKVADGFNDDPVIARSTVKDIAAAIRARRGE